MRIRSPSASSSRIWCGLGLKAGPCFQGACTSWISIYLSIYLSLSLYIYIYTYVYVCVYIYIYIYVCIHILQYNISHLMIFKAIPSLRNRTQTILPCHGASWCARPASLPRPFVFRLCLCSGSDVGGLRFLRAGLTFQEVSLRVFLALRKNLGGGPTPDLQTKNHWLKLPGKPASPHSKFKDGVEEWLSQASQIIVIIVVVVVIIIQMLVLIHLIMILMPLPRARARLAHRVQQILDSQFGDWP